MHCHGILQDSLLNLTLYALLHLENWNKIQKVVKENCSTVKHWRLRTHWTRNRQCGLHNIAALLRIQLCYMMFYVLQGYLVRFTCNSTIYSGFKSRKIQYLSRSHYPREHKWGTSFRALSQLHKWGVKCSFVWGIDHVKQAQNCYRYSHCRSIYCSNQRFREVYKVSYKFPVMKGMFGIIGNNRCNISKCLS